jgi:hypothetical protein
MQIQYATPFRRALCTRRHLSINSNSGQPSRGESGLLQQLRPVELPRAEGREEHSELAVGVGDGVGDGVPVGGGSRVEEEGIASVRCLFTGQMP